MGLLRPAVHILHVFLKRRFPTFEMVVGMVPDTMSGLHDLFVHLGMFVDILTHHEEGCFDLVACQNSQHLRRHFRNGTVVESEVHGALVRTEDTVRIEALEDGFNNSPQHSGNCYL